MTSDEYTNQELSIDVGDGHQLYVQDWGNTAVANPFIFLHGGPGGSVKDTYRGLFDGKNQRVIFFDQRGCGQSTPYGSVEHNSTQDLIADIDIIANHLNLKNFILTGNSWGSCLALAYGVSHPDRVSAMVLKGIFTGSQSEIDWLNQGQFRTFFPDVWEQYQNQTPTEYRTKPSRYHFERALRNNDADAKASAYAYENLEGSIIKLDDRFTPPPIDDYDPSGIKIEMHYMKHRCFMADNYILDNAAKLTMPIWLLQGRYDMVCPPITAYTLAQKLPQGNLIWTVSGHKEERESSQLTQMLLRHSSGLH
jgi:proline iminopeptidase